MGASVNPPYRLRFEERVDYLFVEVTSLEDSAAITLASWLDIAAECERRGARRLLMVDRQLGNSPNAQELVGIVHALKSTVLARMRIAMFEPRPEQLPRLEHAELEAIEVGASFRVFNSLRAAEVWLRYGD
ncbi:MAG: hypothetical protein JSS33_03890 [Proteobacteria bacterium]|nr:hypothetical protein [Pseudomonadota bacterium]